MTLRAIITPRNTDVDLLTGWAYEALKLERLELAQELINLARKADRAGHGPDSTARAEAAKADLFGNAAETTRMVPFLGRTRDEQPGSHAPQQCAAYDVDQDRRCGAAIQWHETPGARGHTGSWHHLDPEITDHEAVAVAY